MFGRAARIGAALLLAAGGTATASAKDAAAADEGAGVPVATLWATAPQYTGVQATATYLLYQYPSGSDPARAWIRSTADGSLAASVPAYSGSDSPNTVVSGSSYLQIWNPGLYTSGRRVDQHDITTGALTAHWDLDSGVSLLGEGEGWILTASGTPGAGASPVQLVRADGTAVTLPHVSIGLDDTTRVGASDATTAVLQSSGTLYAIDLASATATLVTTSAPVYAQVQLSSHRIYCEDLYNFGPTAYWFDRSDGSSGSVALSGNVGSYATLGDGLVAFPTVQGAAPYGDLRGVDLTTGTLGPVLASNVMSASSTGDGRVVLALADSASGHIATLAPGDSVPRILAELPQVAQGARAVSFSGDRVAATFPSPTAQQVLAYATSPDGSTGWGALEPGSAGPTPVQDKVTVTMQLAGNAAVTVQGPGPDADSETDQLSQPGQQRTVISWFGPVLLGHGGQLYRRSVKTSTGAAAQEIHPVDESSGPYPATVETAMDGTWIWNLDAVGVLHGTDTANRDASGHNLTRTVDTWTGCPTLDEVRGRWAVVTCNDDTSYAVDLLHVLAPYALPRQSGDRTILLGDGFVVWTRLEAGSASLLDAVVVNLAPDHASRTYGPVLWDGSSHEPDQQVAVDDAGGPRFVYVDDLSQVRRVDLDWLGATPTGPALPEPTPSPSPIPAPTPTPTPTPTAPAPPQLDTTAPTLGGFTGGPDYLATSGTTATLRLQWSFIDPGIGAGPGSGVASYDIRYQQSTGLSPVAWTQPTALQTTAATSAILQAPVDARTCVQVRGRDQAGNTSGWSHSACTWVLRDDRAMKAHGNVSRSQNPMALNNTVSVLNRKGASLTTATMSGRQLVLVVLRGPGQGSVDVTVGTHRLGRVSLGTHSWQRSVIVLPASAATWHDKVTITSASGKSAEVDGISVRS